MKKKNHYYFGFIGLRFVKILEKKILLMSHCNIAVFKVIVNTSGNFKTLTIYRKIYRQIKNTNNAKSEVRFKQLIRVCSLWCVHDRLFNANSDEKFK
jgi:hypothetical protein